MMDQQEFAKWMQEEYERVRDLTRLLREKLAAVPGIHLEEWLAGLRDRFEHLRAHLQKHIALEEQDGYLTNVLERRPTLAKRVDLLKHDHTELMQIINDIHHILEGVTPADRLLIQDCSRRIQYVLTEMERHTSDENQLVLSVFTRDIGGPE
jgi:iron-sulfur cluster repair protein YtfE (RIC family)